MRIVLVSIGIIILTYIIGGIIYFSTRGIGKRFYHDVIGYHLPTEEYFNGCSFVSKCKFCGKEILQDWHGNWFQGRE